MSACKHPYIKYLGKQETIVKDEYLKLYNCLNCRTTIVYLKNTKSVIVTVPSNWTKSLAAKKTKKNVSGLTPKNNTKLVPQKHATQKTNTVSESFKFFTILLNPSV